ncbi:MAG: amidohydrolase family protein [Gammaproteobacteria bacterium]|nr:amidohydrolase family protein [Gammaproteobacteria bacterium]
MRTEIRGGRVVDPAAGYDQPANLYIDGGRIVAVGKQLADFRPERIIDAAGYVVCPGLVELSAYIPVHAGEAAIAAELHAAAANGITTLCIPPNANLIADSPANVELVHQRAQALRLVRVEVIGALTNGLQGEQLAEMFTLMQAGCPVVSNGAFPIRSTEVMRRALEYAATFDLTVLLHCQDPWLTDDRLVHGGEHSFSLGLEPVPEAAETVAVARELLLLEQTGTKAHFCRLSTARAVAMIEQARARGLRVSADAALPYLFLSESDINGFDVRCHVYPPLRTQADRDSLRSALRDGTLSCATTDHRPLGMDAKANPFPAAAPGISGLDTALPLLLRWMSECDVPLIEALARMTSQPAQLAGLDRGTLQAGAGADVCLFAPQVEFTVDVQRFYSQGKNSPFDGDTVRGEVKATLVGGHLIHQAADLRITQGLL